MTEEEMDEQLELMQDIFDDEERTEDVPKVKYEPWQYKAENAVECPFCSSKSVSVKHKEVRYLGQNAMGVKKHKMKAYCICNKCKANGTPVFYIGYSNATFSSYDEDYLPVYSCGDKAIEAWNTRKPIERIVERLEHEKEYENSCDDDMSCGASVAYSNAIKIVKEEGMNQ